MIALYLLATQPSSFKSGTLYDVNMHGRAPFVPFEILEVIIYFNSGVSSSGVPSMKQNSVPDPLIQATKHGIIELARTILEEYPEAADTFDENRRNILHIAVEQKNKFIYAYLSNNVSNKERMMADVDHGGNTVMHLAANKRTYPNVPPSPVYQLTWNVFWFKRIMYDFYGKLWNRRNSNGKTATELFEENHTELQKEAEKTARELANGVMIVAALIGTINFAAIFIVPGGFDSSTG